jgi:hypothetical protein
VNTEISPEGFDNIHDAVVADIRTRQEQGEAEYGRPHRLHNGLDALQEAYEEALDLVFWLRQYIEEKKLSDKHD